MKKILILFAVVVIATISLKAEQLVGSYENSYFKENYSIEAAEKNGKLSNVYIQVSAKDSKKAFLSVDAKNLESFKVSLANLKQKYVEWVKVAEENNVTEMNKEMGISFPTVTIAWLGSKWWFDFDVRPNFNFIILDNGKMVASWAPKAKASSNRYIDETIYFVFASIDDFDSLISQLNYQRIMDQLLSKKNQEDLFK